MTSASTHSTLFSDESLRKAVADMMCHTVKPAAPRPAPHRSTTQGQQLIAALGDISSLEQLIDYEEDLRATLASREVGGRGRIQRLQLEEECLLEESYVLLDVEQAARSLIVADYNTVVAIPAALISLSAAEEQDRLAMALEYRADVKRMRLLAAPVKLFQNECDERRYAESVEALLRQEMTQRRYIQIGECAQITEHCLYKAKLQEDAWMYSIAFLAAARRLFASEAADRESLELMFLFHRATFVTMEKAERAAAMRESIEWISTQDILRAQKSADMLAMNMATM